jgi:hypothetical protein
MPTSHLLKIDLIRSDTPRCMIFFCAFQCVRFHGECLTVYFGIPGKYVSIVNSLHFLSQPVFGCYFQCLSDE